MAETSEHPAPPEPLPDDARRRFRVAQALHAAGRPADAARVLEAILLSGQADFDAAHLLGIVLLEAGQYERSIRILEIAIGLNPDIASAHSNLGVALRSAGRLEEAVGHYDRAIALKPDSPDLHANLGNALKDLGRPEAAIVSFDRAIALKPDHAAAHGARALALQALGRIDEAIAGYDALIALRPGRAEAHFSRAAALLQQGRHAAALPGFERAIKLRPDYPEAHFQRGRALQGLGHLVKAVAAYDRAIALRPDHAEAWCNRGNALRDLMRPGEAVAGYDKAIALKPDLPAAHYNRGVALHDLERFDEAIASFDRAIALKPDFAEAHYNRGVGLRALKRPDDAIASYDQAIAFKPDYAEAWFNRGNVLQGMRRLEDAIASYDEAIALNPDFATAHWNRGWARLLSGDFEAGWRDYEWRNRKEKPIAVRAFAEPAWRGESDITGRRLFVHWEQGFGDTIQFCRYAPLAAARGAEVVLSVQAPLVRLLKQLEPGIEVIGGDEQPAAFDLQSPLLSLPLAFGTTLDTIPAEESYLRADPEEAARWLERLPATGRPRIGLAWSGAHGDNPDYERSLTFAELKPLLALDADWICLQKEIRAADGDMARRTERLAIFGEALRDFADTAALIDGVDLVVTVDTAVAHLAGAMGKPVWILLPFMPDWRWLRDREDSPWYPSARLFRQPRIADWAPVVERVKAELAARFALKPVSGAARARRGAGGRNLGRPGAAADARNAAAGTRPDEAKSEFGRGVALQNLGRFDEALVRFDRAIALRPDLADAHGLRGNVLQALGRHDEAVASYDTAIALRPDHAETWSNRAAALEELDRSAEALASCDRAIDLNPDYAYAHGNRGNALQGLRRSADALASYDQAIALQPDFAGAHSNRAGALSGLDRFDEAIASCDRAIALDPDEPAPHANRGVALQNLGRYDEAVASFDRAIALKPDFAEVHFNKSLCRLVRGDFAEGWRLYEWRAVRERPFHDPDPAVPLWLGQADLAGKTIFVYWEQGLGDTLHFFRYLRPLAALGGRVVFSAPDPLVRLLRQLEPEIEVVGGGEQPPAFDYHCPLMSLPLALGASVDDMPAQRRPLLADPDDKARWLGRLPASGRPRIGVAWAGNPAHKNDRNRSIGLSRIEPLLAFDADWICLQNALHPGDPEIIKRIGRPRLFAEPPKDFADTAALIDCMDLVVTVDTSVAHLAAAMGKPVWILLPFMPDWRWLLDREDSPWYPSARLFRQPRIADWETVVQRVKAELEARFGGGA